MIINYKNYSPKIASNTFITNKNLYSLLLKNEKDSLYLFLGILNCKLISRLYLEQVSQATKDDFPQVTIKDILGLPMPAIEPKEAENISSFAFQMLDSKKQLASAITDSDKNFLQNKCNSLDRQIDKLVYELYNLTDEEKDIIENS